MRILVAVLLVGSALGQVDVPSLAKEHSQVVPARVLQAKKAMLAVYWPNGPLAAKKEVQGEAETFLRKWHRFELVGDIKDADIAILVTVEPFTKDASFAQRAYSAWAQSGNVVALPPGPQTVLTGTIQLFDAADIAAELANGAAAKPILYAISDYGGNKPLKSAGKKLRKMIDGTR